MAACALGVLAWPALAANVSVSPRPDYTRVTFGFGKPVRLQLGGGGTTVILNFDPPLDSSATGIKGQLGAIANNVTQSADGKQLILTLKKNYRVRQFTSGNAVGIDILSQQAPEPKTPPPATPKPEPKAEPKPQPKVEPVKVIKPPPPAAKEPPLPVEESTPAPEPDDAKVIRVAPPSIMTTKEEPPVPQPAPTPKIDTPMPGPEVPPVAALGDVEPKSIKVVQAENPVLTTKTDEPLPTPEPAAEEKTPPAEEPLPSATPAPAPAAATPPAVREPAAQEGPFLVGVKPTTDGTRMDFPWKQRTAAAIFERGNEVWIIFSHEADMNASLLRTLLPKSIVRIDQLAYPGASVLRLTTDGKTHAIAMQPKGSYAWQIMLSTQVPAATLDVPVSGERDDANKAYLQLSAFDVSDPLNFYDPHVGDLLVVIPTYELGRGIANKKTTPELTLLQTQQGIAIASLRDGLTTMRDRNGVKLYGAEALAVSQNLPVISVSAAPVPGVTATSNVMIPYDQWYVAPKDFIDTRAIRIQAFENASAATKPEALMDLVRLYMGQGMAPEALGYLQLMQQQYPNYYRDNKLSLLTAAASLLANRIEDASRAIAAPELADVKEAALWRDAISLFAPAPGVAQAVQQVSGEEAESAPPVAPTAEMPQEAAPADSQPALQAPKREFDFLKYNKSYIRYYPPRIRQRLAIMAADYYLNSGQDEQSVATYDTLNSDGILAPVQPYAELMLGMVAAHKDKPKEAQRIFDRLSHQQQDPYIQARARYESAMMQYQRGIITPKQAADTIENIRMSWRNDGLEREMLYNLAQIYLKDKRYDDTLRSWKTLLQNFPGDPETLTLAGDMTELFENLFLHGLADDMPPLKSLALFYEFRELTPIGKRGDEIIQKLADRLAAVDLLDRATQLLEHQIKFRVSGETRARVGARLALLYLLNKQPQRALEVLEITNYGDTDGELRRQRLELSAQALAATKRPEEALSLLFNDDSREGGQLRLEILWNMQDWPNVINEAEDTLAARPDLTQPLTDPEAQVLLKLALAYAFEGDQTQLRYLRDYYMGLLGETPYKEIFDFITNDTNPLDTSDVALVAKQISRTESFLDTFRKKIAEQSLSAAVK